MSFSKSFFTSHKTSLTNLLSKTKKYLLTNKKLHEFCLSQSTVHSEGGACTKGGLGHPGTGECANQWRGAENGRGCTNGAGHGNSGRACKCHFHAQPPLHLPPPVSVHPLLFTVLAQPPSPSTALFLQRQHSCPLFFMVPCPRWH